MNTLNTPKPSILACFLRIFIGALCCFGFVLKIMALINGTSDPFEFSSIVSGLIGMVLVARGVNGILLHREDRPLPKSFAAYIWLVIGVPVLISFWAVFLALVDIKEFWPHLLSIFPIAIGLMAISSVYEGRGDAYYLIKSYVTIYAVGIAVNILNLIIEPTNGQIIGLVLKLCIATIAISYLLKSDTVSAVLPETTRSTSKIGKWLTIVCIGIMSLSVITILAYGVSTLFEEDYDPASMTEQYSAENGYHTDGVVAFKIPSHYTITEAETEGTIFFSIKDDETEPSETITIVSELNYELRKEEFDEYYEAWKDEDFAYLSTTVVKDEENTIEGKHYRYRSVYFEDYGTYWDFVIVNQPEINKNCLLSIYTTEPGKRAFFFIRGLKFN